MSRRASAQFHASQRDAMPMDGSGASGGFGYDRSVVQAKPTMTKPIVRDPIYRRRGFDSEVIELCVRWYISYRLSYRDLVELMADRGVAVSHTTIMRWVIRYVPEFEKRWTRFARPVGRSWRVDETYISVRGRWHYLYPRRRQAGQDGRVPVATRPWDRRGTGVFPQGTRFAPARSAQSYPRGPRAESARF